MGPSQLFGSRFWLHFYNEGKCIFVEILCEQFKQLLALMVNNILMTRTIMFKYESAVIYVSWSSSWYSEEIIRAKKNASSYRPRWLGRRDGNQRCKVYHFIVFWMQFLRTQSLNQWLYSCSDLNSFLTSWDRISLKIYTLNKRILMIVGDSLSPPARPNSCKAHKTSWIHWQSKLCFGIIM